MKRKVYRLKDADITKLALCKVGANKQRIFLLKSDDEDVADKPVAAVAQLVKAADDWSVAYVPVAVPDAEENPGIFGDQDSQDVWDSHDEIAKAAHGFMANGAQIVAKHFEDVSADGAKLVESAVALADFDVNGTKIKEGTWYVGLEFDEPTRKLVAKGDIDAVSVEGFATRVAKDAIRQMDTYAEGAESDPDSINLDKGGDASRHGWQDGSHVLHIEMAWCEGRGWPQNGEDPPEPSQEVAKQIAALAKDAYLVPDKPGAKNWIDRTGTGALPKYIGDIAGDLITERGKTTGQAIELAVGIVRNWCHGKGNVTAATRAKACAAAAEWEAKKAQAHAVAKAMDESPLLLRMAKATGVSAVPDIWSFEDADWCETCIDQIAKRAFSNDSRKKLASKGHAMADGSFPIENTSDLANAVKALGRAQEGKRAAVKAHIIKRARALGAVDKLPDDWKVSKGTDADDESLRADPGTFGDMDESEREQIVKDSAEQVVKSLTEGDDAPLSKLAKSVSDLGEQIAEKDPPKPPTAEELGETLAAVEKTIGEKLGPIAKAIEELAEGESNQPDEGKTVTVAKSNGSSDLSGILEGD